MADMPKRPRSHALETKSKRLFEASMPEDWVVTDSGPDYGIDLRVEVFQDGTTTGLQFNVQLKATDGNVRNRWSIRRETLNYWETLASPTLLVIAHGPTETLKYQWVHLSAVSAGDTKSVSIKADHSFVPDTPAKLADEVHAFYLAKELWRHLPIPVVLQGNQLNGMDATPIKRELRRLLRTLPSLVLVTDSHAPAPFASIAFQGDRVDVAISGTLPRPLSWGNIDMQEHRSQIAADIVAAIGVAAGYLGAADLGAAMFRVAAPLSEMLTETQSLPDIIRLLAQTHNTESILTIVRRTTCVEGHPSADTVLAAVLLALQNKDHAEIVAAIGWALRDAARSWIAPARSLYNAAGLLAPTAPLEALKLYDACTAADESYTYRGYWWWEKGRAHWGARDSVNAEACYRKAVTLNEGRAIGPLADVLLRTGRFAEAARVLDAADLSDESAGAQWRLTLLTVHYIVDDLSIAYQDPSKWPSTSFEPRPDSDMYDRATQALQQNAIDGWAHAGVATTEEAPSKTLAAISAAICMLDSPLFWLQVVECAMTDSALTLPRRIAISRDALYCAWVYNNDQFKEEVEDYPLLPDELKKSVLTAFDAIRPGAPVPEIRVWDEAVGEQIHQSGD